MTDKRFRFTGKLAIMVALIVADLIMFFGLLNALSNGDLGASTAALLGGIIGAVTTALGQAGKDFFSVDEQ